MDVVDKCFNRRDKAFLSQTKDTICLTRPGYFIFNHIPFPISNLGYSLRLGKTRLAPCKRRRPGINMVGHVIKRFTQYANFIMRLNRNDNIEIAAGNFLCSIGYFPKRIYYFLYETSEEQGNHDNNNGRSY